MMPKPPVLYRGSVKNVRGEVSNEFLWFEFSERYSIFDWGEMPDLLKDKGTTLAVMGKSFFTHLEKPSNWKDLFSHSILGDSFDFHYLESLKNSKTFSKLERSGLTHHALLDDGDIKSPYLKVKNITVVRPPFNGKHYDYSAYKDKLINTLVPLEVIFRLGLSSGNSLSKRCGNDLMKWKKLGFDHIPEVGLQKIPIIDFSTKLERSDRYLDSAEAQFISGMDDEEWGDLQELTHLIALNLFVFHHELGLELWDGKIEMAFVKEGNSRSFILVDSIGIDELRLLYRGEVFSKEFLREAYKNSPWYKNLELAKKISQASGEDFKSICLKRFHSSPEKLDPKIKKRAEAVYKSYSNAVSMKVFKKEFFEAEFNLSSYALRYL